MFMLSHRVQWLLVATLALALASTQTPAASAATGQQLWSWGNNQYGQLGNGTTLNQSEPTPVEGMSDVVKIVDTANFTTFVVRADGTVWGWGNNWGGLLGDGTTRNRLKPQRIPKLTKVIDVVTCYAATYALSSDGTVWEWGYDSKKVSEFDTPRAKDLYGPRRMKGLSNIRSLVCNTYSWSMYAVRRNGTVLAWGNNDDGQLGNGTTASSSKPVKVSGLTKVNRIIALRRAVFGIRKDGSVWAWGDNSSRAYGDGTTHSRRLAAAVHTLKGVVDISEQKGVASGRKIFGVKSDGTVLSWGDSKRPASRIPGLRGIKKIVGSDSNVFALGTDGSLWGWGSNKFGQLGTGTRDRRTHTQPAQIAGLPRVAKVELSLDTVVLALGSDGTLWSWGSDFSTYFDSEADSGILGLCDTVYQRSPMPVPALTGVTDIAVSAWSVSALGQPTGLSCAPPQDPVPAPASRSENPTQRSTSIRRKLPAGSSRAHS
ncbi:MAG: hypothetical protein LBK95_18460 [Bifidobacteriaceae bacterium]|nr:hypothetical protein [Bifidobacteriaceae bacterium]